MLTPHAFNCLPVVSIQILHLCMNKISIFGGILITANMALHMNNAHLTYYHLDATWLVGLAWSHLCHPDYLVIKYCAHATNLFQFL